MHPPSTRPYPTSPCPKSHPCATTSFTTPVFHTPRSPLVHFTLLLHVVSFPHQVCARTAVKVRHWDLYIPCWIDFGFLEVDHIWLHFVLQTDPGIQAQLPTTPRMREKDHFPKGCTSILPALALCQCRTLPLYGGWMKWRVKTRLKKASCWTPQVSILSVTCLS